MIKQHPYLPILCDSENGMVFFPLTENTHPRKRWKPRWTAGCINEDGYAVVVVSGKHHRVHRLIAETFIPHIEGRNLIDHINRNRSDNRVENLRWVNSVENSRNSARCDEDSLKYGVHRNDPNYSKLYEKSRPKREPTEHSRTLARERARRYRVHKKGASECARES